MVKTALQFAWIVGLAASPGLAQTSATDKQPDLTGVWGFYAEPGQHPFGFLGPNPNLPFTKEGAAAGSPVQAGAR